MTAFTLQAGIPPIRLVSGMKLKLEAINPTTGAAVAGVTSTAWAVYGKNLSDDAADGGELEIPTALPLLTYGPPAVDQ